LESVFVMEYSGDRVVNQIIKIIEEEFLRILYKFHFGNEGVFGVPQLVEVDFRMFVVVAVGFVHV
jgi:hypothetical protein